jgi:hypothetical protein
MENVVLYNPVIDDDTLSSGGICSEIPTPKQSPANIFPHVSGSERLAGVTRRRKRYARLLSGAAANVHLMIDKITTGGDRILAKAGYHSDTLDNADDIGWSDTVTWTVGTRQIVLGSAHPLLVPWEYVLFKTSAGAYRGIARVATVTNTTTLTISAMVRGSDPVTGDTMSTLWFGSGEITLPITAAASKTVVAQFETNEGMDSGVKLAMADWDTLVDNAYPTIEFANVLRAPFTIGVGDITDERFASLTGWTSGDTAGCTSSQATWEDCSTFKLLVTTAGAGRKAERYKDVGTIDTAAFTAEIRLYHDAIGTYANNDAFSIYIDNGAIVLKVRLASDGLYVYDGAAWNKVGTVTVEQDTWIIWRFDVTSTVAASATVDIYKDGFLCGNDIDCSDVTTATNGLVTIAQNGVTTSALSSYAGFLKISDGHAASTGECFILLDAALAGAYAVKTQGYLIGTEDETFDLDGLDLQIRIDGGAIQTVTFAADGMTAAQVETAINAVLVGGLAYVSGATKIAIRTDSYYKLNSIQIDAASTGAAELGLDSAIHNGTDGANACACIELGTLEATHGAPAKTSAFGTFTDNIIDYDFGCIFETWTVTFTSATAFTVSCASLGVIGAGTKAVAFKVANRGEYYFEIPTSCWGGTWAVGDTVIFTTFPSYKPVWFKEVVPAACPVAALSRSNIGMWGSY